MATEFRWSDPVAIVTSHSTSLDALPSTENALSTAVIDNRSNRKTFISIESYLSSVDLSTATTSAVNPSIYVWFLTSIDEVNYEDYSTVVNPARRPDIILPFRSVTTSQRVTIKNIPFPPYYVYLLAGNRCNAALGATGNTIKFRLHSMEST